MTQLWDEFFTPIFLRQNTFFTPTKNTFFTPKNTFFTLKKFYAKDIFIAKCFSLLATSLVEYVASISYIG